MTGRNSHVLVTGASGFVGRALVTRLATQGTRVSAIGRSLSRLESVFGANPAVSCFASSAERAGSAGLADSVRTAMENGPAGARVTLVHLAGAAHDPALPDSRRGIEIDAITDGLVSALAEAPGMRVVNVSSIAARPDQCRPRSRLEAYGRAKARSEVLLAEAACLQGGGCVSLRPPAIWGPDAPGSFATVRRIVATRVPLPIDSIRARRAYLHIDRLTEVLGALAAHDWPPGCAEVFELADPEPYTLKEIFAAVAAMDGHRLRSLPAPESILAAALRLSNKTDLIDQIFRPLEVSSTTLDAFMKKLDRTSVTL